MTTEPLPNWDLTPLYKGITDPTITADLEDLARKAESLQKKYQEKIATLSPNELKEALDQYTDLLQGIRKLETFAYLSYATNTTSPRHGAFLQKISTQATEIASTVLFFEIEITQLSEEKLNTAITEPVLDEYQHFLHKQKQQKPHRLSSAEETILLKKSLTSSQALTRLYQEQSTKQTYALPDTSTSEPLTIAELLSLSRSPDRDTRQAAARTRHEAHKNDPLHNTFTYNTLMQDWGIDTTFRNFPQPEDSRHLENEISRDSVDTLVSTVVEQYPLVHTYYHLKQRILNFPQLHDYDKYAPLSTESTRYSFLDAKEITLTAFRKFDATFASTANLFFTKNWIDATLSKTKQSGAFCYYATPDTNPYILVNYTGTADDVSTLAHELGHGIHAYLARRHHLLNFDWPITIAETASVFAEMIVFENLKTTITNPSEKLSLYAAKVENLFAAIPRQIAMFRFERKTHALRLTQGELSTEQLNQLWIEEQQAMFGESLSLTEYEESYWQIIPHIFQSPFYVYAYAFGELLTLSLFGLYKEDPEKFTPQYLELLQAGGSRSPQELLTPFGIDLAHKEFWRKGFAEIEDLIKEIAKLTNL